MDLIFNTGEGRRREAGFLAAGETKIRVVIRGQPD